MSRSRVVVRAVVSTSLVGGLAWTMAAVVAHDASPRSVFRVPAGGTFASSGQFLGGETGNGVALGDLDGDGDLDAFVANDFSTFGPEANHVWVNDGTGHFASGPVLGTSDGRDVALGDLDGDGDLDAVVCVLSPLSANVWINQGGAQGGTQGAFAAGASFGSFSSYGVALGDIDQDGDRDAFVVGNSNQAWLNNGSATFTAGPALPFLFSDSVALADLDADGWLDAVVADSASGTASRVYWNDGNWTPGPGSFTPGDPLPTSGLTHAVAVGRLDGDGRPDIFLAGDGADQVYWNDGDRTFSTNGPLAVSDNSWAVALGDVDRDGRVDAVVGNINADPNRLWHNEGGRVFAVTQEFGDEFGLSWSRGLGLADLNGDKTPDLFEATTADDRVWINQTTATASSWQVETVAQRGVTGQGSSIAVDAAGHTHITCIEQVDRVNEDDFRIVHAVWDGQAWTSSVVDTSDEALFHPATSLALDSQGRSHVVYESAVAGSVEQRLRYAYWDGSQWQRQTVQANPQARGHFSLVLDAQDRPRITFYEGYARRLSYARWDGAQWLLEVVDDAADVGQFNSLALDGAGNPHVAYQDYSAQHLKYATRAGSGPWQVTVVDGALGRGEFASLALDSTGRPHIGYDADAELGYARYTGTAWDLEIVPSPKTPVDHIVLAVDADDAPHMVWNIFAIEGVWYGRRDGAGWHTEMAAVAPIAAVGQDLTVDAGLRPHVSFYHGDFGDLRHAVRDQPWRAQTLDGPGLIERPAAALAVGGHDRPPEFSYYKPTAGLVREVAWDAATWQLRGVDFINAPGASPSLAIGGDAQPRVSYHDADTRQLRYAAWDGAAWQTEIVDPNVGTGRFSNLLLQGTRPDIVYWDDTLRRIRLARWDPGTMAWLISANLAGPPAAAGSGHLSAARLSDGGIAVSYFRAEGGELRLAVWNGQAWSDALITTGLSASSPFQALAVDAVENAPAVAYYRQSTAQIFFAYRQGTAWVTQTAASGVSGLTGLALQLALDSRRQPRIAFTAADAAQLASGLNGAWRVEPVYQESGITLGGLSLAVGRRQHVAIASNNGLRHVSTLAASSGPEPWILTPYDPVSPFVACFDFIFNGAVNRAGAAVAALAQGELDLNDLGIFLAMSPLFQATTGGQFYVDLYAAHVQEMSDIVLDDATLLHDSFGTLQNFLPGLEALVTGRGDEVLVTQQMVDDARNIWQRLAAAGSPQLSAAIGTELGRYHGLQDFVGMTFDEWAQTIGVLPPHLVHAPDAQAVEGNGGSANAVFAVTLSTPGTQEVRVDYATADQSAVAGSDYTAVSGTLTFAPGARVATVVVPVTGDAVVEGTETFALNLTTVQGASLGDAQGIGTIVDDDATPSLAVLDASVVEGDSGSRDLVFEARLSGPHGLPVTVAYATANGTATAPGDYTAASGSLTFPAGTTTLPVAVTVVGDLVDEAHETFVLNLTSPQNVTLPDPQAIGTIVNDDDPGVPGVELAHGSEWRGDLAADAGPAADQDFFHLRQDPRSSYEVVLDAASGDISGPAGPLLERLAPDAATVLQGSLAAGSGPARSLRWQNTRSVAIDDQLVRVASAGCGTDCGTDDVYRLRLYETTGRLPRFNNSGSQVTVVLLENRSPEPVAGTLWFWSTSGTLLRAEPFSLLARASLVLNASSVTALSGQSGSITISHDGTFGALAGKAVALEPATGFTFDTPLEYRAR